MSTFDPHLETPVSVLFKGEFNHVRCVDPAATFPGISQANLVMNGARPFNIELEWELTGSAGFTFKRPGRFGSLMFQHEN